VEAKDVAEDLQKNHPSPDSTRAGEGEGTFVVVAMPQSALDKTRRLAGATQDPALSTAPEQLVTYMQDTLTPAALVVRPGEGVHVYNKSADTIRLLLTKQFGFVETPLFPFVSTELSIDPEEPKLRWLSIEGQPAAQCVILVAPPGCRAAVADHDGVFRLPALPVGSSYHLRLLCVRVPMQIRTLRNVTTPPKGVASVNGLLPVSVRAGLNDLGDIGVSVDELRESSGIGPIRIPSWFTR
jgi:hypothetical protein